MFRSLFTAVLALTLWTGADLAGAQTYQQSTIQLNTGPTGFYADVGMTQTVYLPRRLFVHKLIIQVESFYGHSAADVLVNGDRKGNFFISPTDPSVTVTVEQETSSVQITGTPAVSWPQGRLVVRSILAVVSDSDYVGPITYDPGFPVSQGVGRLPFPVYYRTVMGNVANRAIMLTDRLADYANYAEYGRYLLPVKKAAAEARAIAEARGDASAAGRPFYLALLNCLDATEPYLRETFERSSAFELATELMSLREYIRDILD